MTLPDVTVRLDDYEEILECLVQMIIDVSLEKRNQSVNIYLALDDHGQACLDLEQGSVLVYTVEPYEETEDAWLVEEIEDTIAFDARPFIQTLAYMALRERGISDKRGLYD